MCCTCAGSCNHIGNHSFCRAHSGQSVPWYTLPVATGNYTVTPADPYVGRHRKGDPESGV